MAPAMEDVEQPFSGSPPGEGEGEESSSSETANGLVGTVWEGVDSPGITNGHQYRCLSDSRCRVSVVCSCGSEERLHLLSSLL